MAARLVLLAGARGSFTLAILLTRGRMASIPEDLGL
ncbi:hypothetical protein ACSSV6_002334 [Roseovarius sp. MBR-38]|jgi:hypothetical protein